MPRQVVILHGWSDTSKSFVPLTRFLDQHGFKPYPLWLGDYISLDDDVRVEDVAKRMQTVLQEKMAGDGLKAPFDMIVHSTGGLVARQWLASYYPDGKDCPLQRLVMLAPANFGSKLAALGQSMLGRVIKGWKNWFHTGKEMLAALELASLYQWELARRDLFVSDSDASPYGKDSVWPFVIVGSHPYGSKLRQVINENGADGTVRVSAANLNARGATIDFSANEDEPVVTPWPARHGDMTFPLAVLPDRDHASIIEPGSAGYSSEPATQALLGKLIVAALGCNDFSQYQGMSAFSALTTAGPTTWRTVIAGKPTWADITDAAASLARDDAERAAIFKTSTPPDYFHQYMQIVVRVTDDHGADVTDFYLEFFSPDMRSDAEAIYFQAQVLEDVHLNGRNESYRCLFVDRTDLATNYYARIPPRYEKVLAMSVSAASPGGNVSYFRNSVRGAEGHVIVHRLQETDATSRWLKRNCTHFVNVVIPRNPRDQVFKLTKLPRGR